MSEPGINFYDSLRCYPIARPPLGGYLTERPRGNSYENRISTVSYKATFVVSDTRIQIDSAILDRETFK